MSADRTADLLLALVRLGRAAMVMLCLYAHVPLVLGLFPWTEGLSHALFGHLPTPLQAAGQAAVAFLPDLFFLIVIGVLTHYGLRGIRFFFREIEKGSITIPGLDADVAEQKFKIVRFLILVFALIVAFPYLPGSDSKAFQGVSLSAGFASVFGTPIAGAIFGVEVLFVGSILYDVLLPSFIAGITAFQISTSLGVQCFGHSVGLAPVFSEKLLLEVVFAGVFPGLCSFFLVETMRLGKRLADRLPVHPVVKALSGGSALVGLTYSFSPYYLGLGLPTIESSLQGAITPWYTFAVKSVFTAITPSFGGSGGIVTPIFFVGATSGSLDAGLTGLDHSTFAAIGLVAVLAGAANTPIAAAIMALELFGPGLGPYAAVACVISFLMTGHRSVYPSQVLAVRKSRSIDVEVGKEIDGVEAPFRPRPKTVTRGILMLVRCLREKSRGLLRRPLSREQRA